MSDSDKRDKFKGYCAHPYDSSAKTRTKIEREAFLNPGYWGSRPEHILSAKNRDETEIFLRQGIII